MSRNGMMQPDIAITGMECVFPDAPCASAFWDNNVRGVDAVRPIPEGRLNGVANHSLGPDHDGYVACTRGGFIPADFDFAPVRYGLPPRLAESGDPDQFLAIHVIDGALRDAGIDEGDAIRSRCDVVIGRGGYPTAKAFELHLRSELIDRVCSLVAEGGPGGWDPAELEKRMREAMPAEDASTYLTAIPNLIASRAAERLNLQGAAFVVDAACASSLVALSAAVDRLRSGECDAAVVGGVFLHQHPWFWLLFQKLGILSPSGVPRPFDRRADGVVIGEGAGAVVLRRACDSETDLGRAYAVIRGVGVSSDGRSASPLSPSPEGQVRAMQAAYRSAGVMPESVGYVETHGTGTVAGDKVEAESMRAVFGRRSRKGRLGAVKSMIGHTMPAAGMASLIRTAFALARATVPPTLHCEELSPEAQGLPFVPVPASEPWVGSGNGSPPRAAVSAFGFGGINAHVVLESCPVGERAGPVRSRGGAAKGPRVRLRMDWSPLAAPRRRGKETAGGAMPFIGNVLHFRPGREIVAERLFHLAADRYLADHCLLCDADLPVGERAATVPMTMSAEAMAEVAACLAPGLGLTAMRDVRAARWLAPAQEPGLVIRAEASAAPGVDGRREIAVHLVGDKGEYASGTFLFADRYEPPPAPRFVEPALQACPLAASDAYGEGYLFHGPLFRCLARVRGVSAAGMGAELVAGSPQGLFGGSDRPQLLASPVLLDGFGQVVGLRLELSGSCLLPVGVDEVVFHDVPPGAHARVQVYGEFFEVDKAARVAVARGTVGDGSGGTWLTVSGWKDWLIPLSERCAAYHRRPAARLLSVRLDPEGEASAVGRVVTYARDLAAVEPQWLSPLLLGPGEAQYLPRGGDVEETRAALSVVAAAKDAVRCLAMGFRGGNCRARDVELHGDPLKSIAGAATPDGVRFSVGVRRLGKRAVLGCAGIDPGVVSRVLAAMAGREAPEYADEAPAVHIPLEPTGAAGDRPRAIQDGARRVGS